VQKTCVLCGTSFFRNHFALLTYNTRKHSYHLGQCRPQKRLNMTSQAFLQHYKLADRGVFQGSPSTLLMDTELRDQYRDRVLVAMGQTTIAKLKEPVGELE
jgi:hypothetical protein